MDVVDIVPLIKVRPSGLSGEVDEGAFWGTTDMSRVRLSLATTDSFNLGAPLGALRVLWCAPLG